MSHIKINLLSIRELIETRKKRKRRVFFAAKIFVFFAAFIVLLGGVFSVGVLFSSDNHPGSWQRLPLLSQIQRLARSADKNVMGENEDRINVLLLGMGGETHEGGSLTDTIMVASFKPSTGQVALLSVPRDLVIPIPNRGWRKINNVNAFAEEARRGSGAEVTAETIGKIVLNAPIHYYVRVDFDAFSEFIHDLGGVEVCVENTFDDYSYPIRGQEENPNYSARFEHLHIDAGCQEMDGDLALKYVRSRHAAWPEGSDFARSRRQQILLEAVKDKTLSASTLLNPKKLSDLYADFQKHVATNIELWEALRFAGIAREIQTENIVHKVLDDSPEGLLYAAISDQGAYILQPRAGNFSEIQGLFKNIFESKDAVLETKKIFIEVQNGSTVSNLAKVSADRVEALGYEVTSISNAERQDYEKTVIYDFSDGQAPEAVARLKEYFNANVASTIPKWIKESEKLLLEEDRSKENAPAHGETTDILIVLGKEAETLL